jgi:2-methylcitrate dehydratase
MNFHVVRVYLSKATPARRDQLAWKIAEVAADPVSVDQKGKDAQRIRDDQSGSMVPKCL